MGTPQIQTRLMAKVEFDTNGGCWLWSGATNKDGYGRFNHGGRVINAHRASFAIFRASPGALHVLHLCDVRGCVNPSHLFLGTHADNMADMFAKGRRTAIGPRGERAPMARLTEGDVRDVRERLSRGEPQKDIAARYGVTQPLISKIKHGRAWAWMEAAIV